MSDHVSNNMTSRNSGGDDRMRPSAHWHTLWHSCKGAWAKNESKTACQACSSASLCKSGCNSRVLLRTGRVDQSGGLTLRCGGAPCLDPRYMALSNSPTQMRQVVLSALKSRSGWSTPNDMTPADLRNVKCANCVLGTLARKRDGPVVARLGPSS